jgi:hypothetical protein
LPLHSSSTSDGNAWRILLAYTVSELSLLFEAEASKFREGAHGQSPPPGRPAPSILIQSVLPPLYVRPGGGLVFPVEGAVIGRSLKGYG